MRFLNDRLLLEITDYIILFPIKWYNLIKKIINSATVYQNIIIISKSSIINLQNVYFDILDILQSNNLLSAISENKDFYILYFNYEQDIGIFKYWLNLITYRACQELHIKGIWMNNLLSSEFYGEIQGRKLFIEKDIKNNQDIYITTRKSKNDNVINFEYNYFSFCQKLKEYFYLQKL